MRAGQETVLDLTAGNAESAESARLSADSATLLTAWRDSVVEIWTPTRHAAGFVIDAARGLVATSHPALGSATSVEVQLTAGAERIKVPGRVVVSERESGAAVVWIDPGILRSTARDRSRLRGRIVPSPGLQGHRDHDHRVDVRRARK